MADSIDLGFTLNGRLVRVRVRSTDRLVDLLRDTLRLTGTKEGCGTGDCGACTVIMNGRAILSCLAMAFQADGAVLETVEGLSEGGRLHPLQEAFVDRGALQCGYCVPGMLLAAKAALDAGPLGGPRAVREALAGNLCRCSGYSKMVQAVLRAGPAHTRTPPAPPTPGAAPSYYCPRSLEEALEILAQREGEVRPIAGGTDLLVRAHAGSVDRAALFDVSNVPELKGIEERDSGVFIGAASNHREMASDPLLRTWAPTLVQASAAIGGPQIRNRGTIGGALASASPLSDTTPALLVSDAIVHVVSVSSRREVPVDEFLEGSTLARDELILGVTVPKRPGVRGSFLRVGYRQAFSRAKVSVAAAMTFREGRPDWVRVAVGAMGDRVTRCRKAEAALLNGGPEGLQKAREAVLEEGAIDGAGSTAAYRREMAGVLLERAVRLLAEA
jgi:carbon-monoxide dehydrogenase small subunit/xanthine dehydrogenase small subunit